ncbi:retrovirus-related Pol polyprotein from transposon 297 [Trichonephila clavipes]|nr:retrovirus-related Pol polyprotein from transposon 297 [Trichonephila clavipes]
MDLSKGYFQIPLTPRAQRYAAFVTPFGTYIPKKMMFGTIASPLTDALKGKIKKEKITWDEKCGKAFEELKAKLVTQPILFAPDFATEFILQTDASEVGAGVVLSQRIEGEEHPIVFLSKKFSKAERNYSTVERELAAIIFGLKRLKHYLDGQKFIIETDHNPLSKLLQTEDNDLPSAMEFLKNRKDFFNDLRLDTALNEMLCDAREFPDEIDIRTNFELTQPCHRL